MSRFHNKYTKCMLYSLVLFSLVLSLSGCKKKEEVSMLSVGEQKMSYEEVLAYGYIFAHEHNINNVADLQSVYEDDETYAQLYKQQMKDEMIDMLLLCEQASEDKLKLSKDDKLEAKEKTQMMLDTYGDNYFESVGVEASDLEAVYNRKSLAANYEEWFTGGKEDNQDIPRYIKVFQITFQTVLTDEMGNVMTDESGTAQQKSSEKIEEYRQLASDFVENTPSLDDAKKALNEYDSDVFGAEKYLKYDDLSVEYKRAVAGLSVGDFSEPFEGPYGIYVVVMMENDAKEYAAKITDHEVVNQHSERMEEQLSKLQTQYIGGASDCMNADLWKDISMEQFVR